MGAQYSRPPRQPPPPWHGGRPPAWRRSSPRRRHSQKKIFSLPQGAVRILDAAQQLLRIRPSVFFLHRTPSFLSPGCTGSPLSPPPAGMTSRPSPGASPAPGGGPLAGQPGHVLPLLRSCPSPGGPAGGPHGKETRDAPPPRNSPLCRTPAKPLPAAPIPYAPLLSLCGFEIPASGVLSLSIIRRGRGFEQGFLFLLPIIPPKRYG